MPSRYVKSILRQTLAAWLSTFSVNLTGRDFFVAILGKQLFECGADLMHPKVRKSIWAKLSAIGVIYLILLGKLWFSYRLFGQHSPEWLLVAFVLGLPFVFVGGCGVIVLAIKQFAFELRNPPKVNADTESNFSDESDK